MTAPARPKGDRVSVWSVYRPAGGGDLVLECHGGWRTPNRIRLDAMRRADWSRQLTGPALADACYTALDAVVQYREKTERQVVHARQRLAADLSELTRAGLLEARVRQDGPT